MKLLFIIFSSVVCVYARSRLAQGQLLDLGSFEGSQQIGQLSERYYPLNEADVKASLNGLRLAKDVLLPLVDPYKIANVHAYMHEEPSYKLNISGSNVVVTGLRQTNLQELEIRMNDNLPGADPIRLDANVTLPLIHVEADYHGFVDALVLGKLPVTGHIKVLLHNLKLSGAVQAKPEQVDDKIVYQLKALSGEGSVDNVQLQLTINEYPEFENDRELILLYVNKLKDSVLQQLVKLVLSEANKQLQVYPKEVVDKQLRA